MKVTVVKNWQGREEIHKAGCSDLKRRNRPYRLADAMTMEAASEADIFASYWDCIADEAVANGDYATVEHVWWAWQSEFSVKPCAKELPPMADPNKAPALAPAPAPAANGKGKRSANQETARWLVDLVAAHAGELEPEQLQKAVNWLSHLPTGGEGAGPLRYWPEGLVRPDKADWR